MYLSLLNFLVTVQLEYIDFFVQVKGNNNVHIAPPLSHSIMNCIMTASNSVRIAI